MRQLKITKSVTNRANESFDAYLRDISKKDLIKVEQEIELAQRIKKGDQNALNELCEANLRFVVSVAKQYQNQGLSLSDLVNQGNLGLIKAAERFDETRGFKFISYAVWWIRQSIILGLAENSRIVRLPLNKIGDINKINKVISNLEQELERAPTSKEIAEKLKMKEDEIERSLVNDIRHVSTDAPVGDESTNFVDIFIKNDIPDPDSDLIKESFLIDLEKVLRTISEKERQVIILYYGIGSLHGLTLDEISKELGVTKERVRQIKEKAIRRLKNKKRGEVLKKYLS